MTCFLLPAFPSHVQNAPLHKLCSASLRKRKQGNPPADRQDNTIVLRKCLKDLLGRTDNLLVSSLVLCSAIDEIVTIYYMQAFYRLIFP